MQTLNRRGSTSHPVKSSLDIPHIQHIFKHQGLFSTPSGALLYMAVKPFTLSIKKQIICVTELYLCMILCFSIIDYT